MHFSRSRPLLAVATADPAAGVVIWDVRKNGVVHSLAGPSLGNVRTFGKDLLVSAQPAGVAVFRLGGSDPVRHRAQRRPLAPSPG